MKTFWKRVLAAAAVVLIFWLVAAVVFWTIDGGRTPFYACFLALPLWLLGCAVFLATGQNHF